ncbi:MAG TPA: M15 family metallopeptidase [Actinomycetaceae bacterium]|nr:M15 family metallopeptidase [Actinomycetaceae bacterium]
MEGLAAITQRIAGIEAQLTALSNPPAPAPETASSSFDQALSSASGEFAPQAAAAGALAPLAAAAQGLGAPGLDGAGLGGLGATGLGGAAGLLGGAGAFGGGLNTPGLLNALGASGLLGGAGLQGLAGLQGVSGVQGAAGAYAPPAVLNDKGAPADLAHYGNGQIPEQALVPIDDTGHRLWAPAAVQFQQLIAEASAQGITIGINDSYRTIERQHELVPRLGLYNEGGLAAVPGTSRHGWGLAVDLQLNGEAQAWMRDNAERFGFVEDTPREPWHWAFYPDRL